MGVINGGRTGATFLPSALAATRTRSCACPPIYNPPIYNPPGRPGRLILIVSSPRQNLRPDGPFSGCGKIFRRFIPLGSNDLRRILPIL